MSKKYFRSSKQVILGGVAGGFSEFFDFDVTLIRLAFVILAIISLGIAVVVYIVLWIVAPVKKDSKNLKKTKKK